MGKMLNKGVLLFCVSVGVLVFFTSISCANLWHITAKQNHIQVTDFSVEFNDHDNDGFVTIDDMIFFDSVSVKDRGKYQVYDILTDIPVLQIFDPIHQETLTLVPQSSHIDPHWYFANSSSTAFEVRRHWLYTGTVAYSAPQVPIPGAIWLLGPGLVGIIGLRRRLKK